MPRDNLVMMPSDDGDGDVDSDDAIVKDYGEDDVFVEESFVSHILSVQTIIALLCFFGILLSGVCTEILAETSCDAGLDDTRLIMDASVRKLTASASQSLFDVSSKALGYSSSGVSQVVALWLSQSNQAMDNLIGIAARHSHHPAKNTTDWLDGMAADMYLSAATLSEGSPFAAFAIAQGDYGVVTFPEGPKSGGDIVPTPHVRQVVALYMKPKVGNVTGEAHFMTPLTGSRLFSIYPVTGPGVDELPSMSLSRTGVIVPGETKFPNIVPLGVFAGYCVVGKIPDPVVTGEFIEGIVFVSLDDVSTFLKKLTTGTTGDVIYRLFTVVASSWVSQSMKSRGDAGWEAADQSGLLTGVSHGSAV